MLIHNLRYPRGYKSDSVKKNSKNKAFTLWKHAESMELKALID